MLFIQPNYLAHPVAIPITPTNAPINTTIASTDLGFAKFTVHPR